MIPYVTPTDLLGDPSPAPSVAGAIGSAPLGVNLQQTTLDRLWQMCHIATNMCDSIAGLTLRAASSYEELNGPGHRLGFVVTSDVARFITSRKPIISVISGQVAYGGPPFNWTPIPLVNLVPEETPFTNPGSAAVSTATSGTAAILIGQGWVNWTGGRNALRVGLRYLSGWPITGVTPAATIKGTASGTYPNITQLTGIPSTLGVAVGAPVSGLGPSPAVVPSGVTVTAVTSSTVTLSASLPVTGTWTLTVGYPAGVTTLNADDVTAWNLGMIGTLYDGAYTESLTTTGATANTSGLQTPAGPGSITLSTPTLFAHMPGIALSAMPERIRWAAMLGVKLQILERGAPAVTSQGLPGRSSGAGSSAIERIHKDMVTLLAPDRRVI